jgi:hypothetical protein
MARAVPSQTWAASLCQQYAKYALTAQSSKRNNQTAKSSGGGGGRSGSGSAAVAVAVAVAATAVAAAAAVAAVAAQR